VISAEPPAERLRAAALAFFDFFAANPRDLDFGFYLFKGGLRPRGLSKELDAEMNARLADSLAPIGAAAKELGADEKATRAVVADAFGHAVGLLMLEHTHRIRMFGCASRELMDQYVDGVLARIGARRHADV
jgi:hypothetical protein